MDNICGVCLLRRTDRLSNLPDSVFYHILSFLETKDVVQTSVLARRWRCAWKSVPALNFRSQSFRDYTRFKIFVYRVLCLRYPLGLRKIAFVDEGKSQYREGSLFARVILYGFSHDAKHLVFDLRTYKSREEVPEYYLYDMFKATSGCNFETLELNSFMFDAEFQSLGFRMLTKLELFECTFVSDHEEVIDSFSGFPCLEHLVLVHPSPEDRDVDDKRFRISGLGLLSLSVTDSYFKKLEIHAPKLEHFNFNAIWDLVEFTELNLPSLDQAVINISDVVSYVEEKTEDEDEDEDERGKHCLMSLLRGLGNATTLKLSNSTIELLCRISEFLKKQHSPFTRLETLSCGLTDGRDDALIDYFVKGSSGSGTKRQVKIEWPVITDCS
ncbi:Putative F-box/FBD/LRR-repeat protein At1g78760 [Linum grandiflorum]